MCTIEKPFKCDTCVSEFLHSSSLREHCRRFHGLTLSGEAINGYRCDCCGNTFASKVRFERHRETVPERTCTVCGKICDRLSKLVQHMRSHTGEKPFKCSTCGAVYSRIVNLNKHCLAVHGRRVSSEYCTPTAPKRPVRKKSDPKCPHCDRVFKSLYLMKRHMTVHTGEKPYACDTCGLTFTRKDSLKQHCLRVHTSSDELPTPSGKAAVQSQRCSICGMLWQSPSLLKRHMRLHTGEKPYACDTCGLKFSQKDTLKRHYLTKHEMSMKPYVCDTCGLKYSCKYSLRQHCFKKHGRSTASGKLPPREHKCLICGTLWYTPSKLKAHMVVHTREKVFACDVCGDRFACKKYIRKHCVRVHGKNTSFPTEPHGASSHGEAAAKPQPATEQDRACPKASFKAHQKKYLDLAASTVSPATDRTCPHCGEFFAYPSDMKQHMRVHTCEKPFGCDVCNKSFKWKANLKAHQKKMHTDLAAEQDRTCPICGMVFDSPSRMKWHMIQHTGEKPYQCSTCVEYFSQAAALEEHHQKMHKKGKERIPAKDRTCKFCDAIFSTIAELVCHSQKECAYL